MEENNYYISVGEPWDFKSQDGPNIIKGNILKALSNRCVLFRTNFYLDIENIKSNILVLSPRNREIDFNNLDQGFVSINAGLLFPEFSIESNEKELKQNSKFIIIGSLSKINK